MIESMPPVVVVAQALFAVALIVAVVLYIRDKKKNK